MRYTRMESSMKMAARDGVRVAYASNERSLAQRDSLNI